jgi:hypothetical protein
MKRNGWILLVTLIAACAALGGCGYTDLEMAAKQRQIDALTAQLEAAKVGAQATCPAHERPAPRSASSRALSSR